MIHYDKAGAFFDKFKKMYLQNPGIEPRYGTFYTEFASFGIAPSHAEYNSESNKIADYFKGWINDFSLIDNIRVYHDNRQERFLQFRNKGGRTDDDLAVCYKLYLSFPKDVIYEAVEDIFTFMANNNMLHVSKVADKLRSDSVVLRVYRREDALKVINYINNNPKFTQHALPTNPLLPTNGIVGYAYDDNLSYNQMTCIFLKMYFQHKRREGTLQNASIQDFFIYMNNASLMLNSKEGLYQLLGDSDLRNEFNNLLFRLPMEKVVLNIQEVINLIKDNIDPNYNFQDYMDTIESFQNKEQKEEKAKKNRIMLGLNPEVKTETGKELFDSYIIYAASKYGADNVKDYVRTYLMGGEYGITRDHNFRERFKTLLPRQTLEDYLGNNLEAYIKNKCNEYYYSLFDKACAATINKYDTEQLMYALDMLLNGVYDGFTNDDNARLDLMDKVPYKYARFYAAQKKTELQQRVSEMAR